MLSDEEELRRIKETEAEWQNSDMYKSKDIVPLNDEDKLKFHKYMKSLARALLGDTYDLDQENLVFLLSDDLKPNAALVPSISRYSFIYITTPLFRMCENKDQLAFLLGHELGHFEKYKEKGIHLNNKAEEEYADLTAISKMIKAGLNIEQAYQFSQILFNNRYATLKALADEHMLDDNRIKLLGDMVTSQRKELLGQGVETKDIIGDVTHQIDEDIVNLVQEHPHNPTLKDYFFSEEFLTLSSDEKVTAYFKKVEECFANGYTFNEPDRTILKDVASMLLPDDNSYHVNGQQCSRETRMIAAALEAAFKETEPSSMYQKTEAFTSIIDFDTYTFGAYKDLNPLQTTIRKEFEGFRESVSPDTDMFMIKRKCIGLLVNSSYCHSYFTHLWFGLDYDPTDVGKKFSQDVLKLPDLNQFYDDFYGDQILAQEDGSTILKCSHGIHITNEKGVIELFSNDVYNFRTQFVAKQINDTVGILNDIRNGKEVDPDVKLKNLLKAWLITSSDFYATFRGDYASIHKDKKALDSEQIQAMGLLDFEKIPRDQETYLALEDIKAHLSPDALSFYEEKHSHSQTSSSDYTSLIKEELLKELKAMHDSGDKQRADKFLDFFIEHTRLDRLDDNNKNYRFYTHPEKNVDFFRAYIDLFGKDKFTATLDAWGRADLKGSNALRIIDDARLKIHFDTHHTLDGFESAFGDVFDGSLQEYSIRAFAATYSIFSGKPDFELHYNWNTHLIDYFGSNISTNADEFHTAVKERFKQNVAKASHWDVDGPNITEDKFVQNFYQSLEEFKKGSNIQNSSRLCLYQYAALNFYEKASIENKIQWMSKALGLTISTGENTETLKAFKQKCDIAFRKDFENPKISLNDRLRLFTALAKENLFDETYENYFEILTGKDGKGGLLKEIEEYQGDKASLYLNLIASEHRIVDPAIREDLIKKTAFYWVKEHGQYNDITASQSERDTFISQVTDLKRNYVDKMYYDDADIFLRTIADSSLSQEQLSAAIAPSKVSIDTQDKKAITAAYGLDAFHFLTQRRIISSEELQDFFLGGSSTEEISQQCDKIKKKIRSEIAKGRNSSGYYTCDNFLNGLTEGQALNYIDNLITPQYMMQIKKEFDTAPLIIKGAVIQMSIEDNNWEQQFNTVANKLFDDTGELGNAGKRFLYNYIASRQDSERSFYLAAIYVAAQNKSVSANNSDSPYTPEQRSLATGIRLFLENSGPAGIKLAQAMASYSDVPDFIRDEMQKAKNHANPPARWEVFDWLRQSGQKDLLNHGKIGKLLGSASFFATFDLHDGSSNGKVVKILRGGAKALADNEFDIYKGMLDKMAPEFPGITSFKRLVDYAASMVEVETNLYIGEKQLRDAQKLYPDKVSSDGTEFRLQIMDWNARGKNWASMEKAQGKDFKELEQPYKKAAAKAVFTTELANMLSGQRFDSDRHAGQYKFDTQTNTIGIFDTGSISIVEPTAKDKEILGRVLANTVLALKDSKDANAGTILSAEVDKGIARYYGEEIRKGEPVPPYLCEFLRGLLALNDFYSEIPPKELADCFVQALNNGKNKLNHEIYQGFTRGLTGIQSTVAPSLKQKLSFAEQAVTILNNQDVMTPEARTAQKIGRVVTALAIEKENGYEVLTSLPDRLKKEGLSLDTLDSKCGQIQFAKGIMKEAIYALNPSNYPPEERRELGAVLYQVAQKAARQRKSSISVLLNEELARMPNAGEYAQTIKKIVNVTSSIGYEPSLDDFKKAVVFGRAIDEEVQKGYSEALLANPRTGAIRSTLEKYNPLNFAPQQTVKKVMKTIIKQFAPQCFTAINNLRHHKVTRFIGKLFGQNGY